MIVGSFGLQRGRALVVAALAVLVLATGLGVVPTGTPARSGTAEHVRVIVQKTEAADPSPELAVRRLGGPVTRDCRSSTGSRRPCPGRRRRAERRGRAAGGHPRRRPASRARPAPAAQGRYPKVVRADDVWQRGVPATVAAWPSSTPASPPARRPRRPGRPGAQRPHRPHRAVQEPHRRADVRRQLRPRHLHRRPDRRQRRRSNGEWNGVAPKARILSVKAAGPTAPPTSATSWPPSSGSSPSRTGTNPGAQPHPRHRLDAELKPTRSTTPSRRRGRPASPSSWRPATRARAPGPTKPADDPS